LAAAPASAIAAAVTTHLFAVKRKEIPE